MELRLLAFACLLGAAFAGPVQTGSRCSASCPSTGEEKFNYQPGRKYVFDYKGVNYIQIVGTQKQQKAEIHGTAEIHVQEKCEMVLKLRDIRLQQNTEEEETRALIEKLEVPLPFAFVDGKIEHVCGGPEETPISLNIKKGILSTLVNSMTQLENYEEVKEVDSLGTCDTKYVLRHLRDSIVAHKEKDLKSCNNRHSAVTAVITNPYDSPDSNIHSLPIFTDEKLVCDQEIRDRVIHHVKCIELAKVQPLRERGSVISFEGEIELTLVKTERTDRLAIPSQIQREEILYNYGQVKAENREAEVEHILSEICSKGVVDPTISKDYFKLVLAVKTLPYPALERIYNSLKSGRMCNSQRTMDIFLDTLPMAGSDSTIKLMVKLLKDKEVTGLKAKLWPASLALIPKPTHETVAAIVPLVIEEEKSAPVLLGVSSVIFRYCQYTDCERSPAVRSVVQSFARSLGRHCSSENETEVVSILKAFGNMGYLGEAEETILECVKSEEKPISLRLAAIDAFRRTQKKRPMELIRLYANPSQNFEVRIACLAAVLKKAEMEHINVVKEVMEKERDEQVAAYTATLISNLKKTSCPLKNTMKKMLEDVTVRSPKVGYWENSKNIELSAFNVPLNLGAGLEADIIHSPESKIPRSIYTKFDIDVFGSNINLFEIGMRAEGLEAAAKKLLGFDKPNERQRWSLLRSKASDESKTEASFFLRTMNTEILDLSVSDITSVGKMMEVADIVNKLSKDKNIDFSHSFLFMNSKLVIPSVTGRSYSFGMTGSATIGLTASSKFDVVNLMSQPSNCDVHGRFQPSVNVELAATVGIQSEKPRPDIKIVTLLHSESNIEAQFKVKDGHMALAKVSLPSENVLLSKISTDVIEIEGGNEKRLVEDMQQKINTCINTLEKPLGLSFCGKLEVPRPFLSKTFPFVKGIGNVELAIKKTDPSMSGYEFVIEIPKYMRPNMHYKMALDTPGSRITRRFSADLELRKQAEGKRDFTLELKSPFKDASATGSYTLRDDLVQGSVEVDCGSSYRYSLKASSQIMSSGPKKVFRPVIELSIPRTEPIIVGGTVEYNEGRKQQITFDLKANKPTRKPIALEGTIIKDGVFGLSKSSEWKFSSDVSAKLPFITLQVRSATEKQSRQSQTVSTSFLLGYQPERSQKHTVKFACKAQQNLAKLSTFAQFETTQFPIFNWFLNWNMQGNFLESVKNDITLKYGRNPERNYINVVQSSKLTESDKSECKVIVKAPQFNVDSELDLGANLNYKQTSEILLEADLRYKADKHVRGHMHFNHISKKPLKMSIKCELEYPGRKITYRDEITETSSRIYEGNSILQWQQDKQCSLKYLYRKLSDDVEMHHEIETTLRLPWMSPISHKSSMRLSPEKIGVEGRLILSRQPEYFVEALLQKSGPSHASFKVPKIEGKVNVVAQETKKTVNLDMKLNTRRSRHIIASAGLELGSKKYIEGEIQWDADHNPLLKISGSTLLQLSSRRSGYSYTCVSKLQVTDIVKTELSGSGDIALFGNQEISLEASGKHFEPVSIALRHEMTPEQFKSSMSLRKSHSEKINAEIRGKVYKRSDDTEVTFACLIKSPDHSFEDKEISAHHVYSLSHSSMTLKSSMKLKCSPEKIYETEVELQHQPKSMEIKALLSTPHRSFEKQSLLFSHHSTDSVTTCICRLEYANQKQIALSSVIKAKNSGMSLTWTLTTPYREINDAKLFASVEYRRSKKNLECYIDLNSERKADFDLNMLSSPRGIELTGRVKTAITPEISAQAKVECNDRDFLYQASILKESIPLLSTSFAKQSSSGQYLYKLEAKSRQSTIIDLKLSKEMSVSNTKRALQIKGPFSPVSMELQSTHSEPNSMSVTLNLCKESPEKVCYAIKGYHKALKNSENYRLYRKITFDIEKSAQSGEEHVGNIHFILAAGENNYRSKLMFEAKEKTLGYEVKYNHRERKESPCHLDMHVFLPTRAVRISSSAINNAERVLFDLEVTPNAAVPSRKFVLEIKKENSRSSGIVGHIKLSHPHMQQPIVMTSYIEKEGFWPVSGKFELEYSPSDKFILDISRQSERSQYGGKLIWRLYRQDERFDVGAKISTELSRSQDLYGYEWHWKSQRGEKTGAFEVKLYEKRSGKPHAIDITYRTPSVNLEVNCHTVWSSILPSEANLRVLSQKQQIYQLNYKKDESCAQIEVLRSGPFMNTKMCYNKPESDKLMLLSVESYYKNHKCLHASIDLDPRQSYAANIEMQWDKEDIRHALTEMEDLTSLLRDQSLMELEEEIVDYVKKCWQYFKDHCYEALVSKIRYCLEQTRLAQQQTLISIKNSAATYIEKLPSLKQLRENYWWPIYEQLRCMVVKTVTFMKGHVPDALRVLWDILKDQYENCLKKYCPRGSFCYQIKRTYERHGLKQAQQLAQQKLRAMKHDATNKILKATDWVPELREYIREKYEALKSYIKSVWSPVMDSEFIRNLRNKIKEYERLCREKCFEYYNKIVAKIEEIIHHANRDEDFRVVKSVFLEVKEKALRLWEKRDQIKEEILKPVRELILEDFPRKFIKDKVSVERFSLSEGNIKIQLSNPFNRSAINMLKNTLFAIKNRILSPWM